MIPSTLRLAVQLQITYGVLVALWQIVGLWRLASARPRRGSTTGPPKP